MSFTGPIRTQSVVVVFDTFSATNVFLPPPLLPAFRFDAATSAVLSSTGQVSSHPVEASGLPISDHFRTNPDTLTVTGVVSDTPLTSAISIVNVVQGSPIQPLGNDNAINLYSLLRRYRAERRRLFVVGSWFTFGSSVCTNVTATHGQTEGASLTLSCTFQQVRVASPQLVPSVVDADVQAAGFTANGATTGQATDIGSWTGSGFSSL